MGYSAKSVTQPGQGISTFNEKMENGANKNTDYKRLTNNIHGFDSWNIKVKLSIVEDKQCKCKSTIFVNKLIVPIPGQVFDFV